MSTSTPPFFIPSNRPLTSSQSESLYRSIKSYVSSDHYPLSSRRIFRLDIEHNGTIPLGNSEIEVGKRLGDKGETVVAIFEIAEGKGKGWCLIVTKSNGALKGAPKWVAIEDVAGVVGFAKMAK